MVTEENIKISSTPMNFDAQCIGLDIGGTTTKIAIVSNDGSVDALTTIPTAGPAPALLEAVLERIADLPECSNGIGVGVAGFVDEARSMMAYNPNVAWLEGFPLRAELEQRSGRRVALDSDSNAACLAEFTFGVGRGSRRFLCLSIGTGVGGGMIVDGEIVRLAHGGLGDIGHVIVQPFGPLCGSGCHGCAEALISAPGILARWGQNGDGVREIVRAAQEGDAKAAALLVETGRLLGIAIASQAVVLFPDVVAIAGGVAEADELLLAPAREAIEALTGPFYRSALRMERAALGWRAALVGAALPLLTES
jgi:glucokinase